MVVGLEIPDFRTVAYYTPISTSPQYCKRWYDEFVDNTRVLYETCTEVWPAYLATIKKLEHSRERIQHIMEVEIPAVIPNFRLRQYSLLHQPILTLKLNLIWEEIKKEKVHN